MNSRFQSVIWAEQKLPEQAEAYQKCETCTPKSRVIWGEGNPKAPIFIILDNPGAREDKDGNEFICPTRQTLQAALNQVNLHKEDVYLTYLLKCRPLRKYDKERARAFSMPFLISQIEKTDPRYIVCLGDVVTGTMFGDKDMKVKNKRGSWHTLMEYPCMISYHPLAVRRRPNLAKYFIEDWSMLAKRLQYKNN